MIDLSVDIGGIKIKNPVITASGTFGFGREYGDLYDLSSLGAIAVKGITYKARGGNAPPRIAETASGVLNSVGLENPGINAFIDMELPNLKKFNVPIIVNISGNTIEEFGIIAEMLDDLVDFIELNVSCPNVKEGGMAFGIKADSIYNITYTTKKTSKVPIIVKLSPNVTDITEMAKAAEAGGADCISLINTITGMKIDINKRKPYFENIIAGLSGPAIKPIALKMVWETASNVNIPIIGMGGIMNWQDAVEFLMAGADAISVGTANFIDPFVPIKVLDGLMNYMEENNKTNLKTMKIF